jgi:NitT/TauT family transport system substrate-binding protein
MLRRLLTFSFLISLLPSCTCQQKTKIKIGINPWPGYELLWLAHEKDLYKAHGLEEEMVEYASLVDAQSAMGRGHIDILCSTAIEVILLNDSTTASEPPAKIILVPDFSNGADVIISRNGMSGNELKGKKIGIEQGSLGEFILKRFLDKNNMTAGDVTAIGMDQSKIESSMLTGSIDAAITYPPISLYLQKQNNMKTIFTSADIPGEVIDTISASSSILKADPALPAKIRAVWASALKFYRDNPKEAIEIMARHERISPQEMTDSMTGLTLISDAEQSLYFGSEGKLLKIMDSIQSALKDGGTIKQPKDLKALLP